MLKFWILSIGNVLWTGSIVSYGNYMKSFIVYDAYSIGIQGPRGL